jgi:hypothetical protein
LPEKGNPMSEKLLDEKELQEAIHYEIISPSFAERVRQLINAYAASQLTPREPDSLKAGAFCLPDVVKSESNLPA